MHVEVDPGRLNFATVQTVKHCPALYIGPSRRRKKAVSNC
jgi:hypothetical protein